MSEQLTREAVLRVAALSRLACDETQADEMAEQLTSVLGYMDQLNTLDVDDVEPMSHPTDQVNHFRVDEPQGTGASGNSSGGDSDSGNSDSGDSGGARYGLSTDEVLANAPATHPPFFQVPKTLGGESS